MINVYTATNGRANRTDCIAKFASLNAAEAFVVRITKEGKGHRLTVAIDPVDDGKRINEWVAWGF